MKKKSFSNFFNKIIGYFLRGALFIIPFYLTVYIISFTLTTLDSFIKVKIPGLGIAIIIGFITLVGYIASSFLIKSILDSIEKFTLSVPLINLIYSSFKEMTSAFVGNKKKFNVPILMILTHYPLVYKVGFITQDDLSVIKLKEMVAVYVPGAYTLSGNLYLVKKKDIIKLDIPSGEVMKFCISGGVTSIPKHDNDHIK